MKKLFAIVMALVLALSGLMAASAEGNGGTINLKLELNGDMIAAMTGAQDEESAKPIKAIVDLVNGLAFTCTSDGTDAELFISLNGSELLGLGVLKAEAGLKIVSSLFPSYAFVVEEAMMGGQMPKFDLSEAQLAELAAPFNAITQELMTRIGEPEAVEETLYDVVFTVRTPINITSKELALMALNAVKQVASTGAFAAILSSTSQMGSPIDVSKIDETIEQISNSSDEDMPALDAAAYTNEGEDALISLIMTREEQTIDVLVGEVADTAIFDVAALNQLDLVITEDKAGHGTLDIAFAPQEGMNVALAGDLNPVENGFNAQLAIALNEMNLATVYVDGTANGVLSGAFTAEGKTEVSVAAMQDQESELVQGFMTEVQTGAMTLLGIVMQAAPELATLMSSMMAPQTAPAQ